MCVCVERGDAAMKKLWMVQCLNHVKTCTSDGVRLIGPPELSVCARPASSMELGECGYSQDMEKKVSLDAKQCLDCPHDGLISQSRGDNQSIVGYCPVLVSLWLSLEGCMQLSAFAAAAESAMRYEPHNPRQQSNFLTFEARTTRAWPHAASPMEALRLDFAVSET